MIALPTSTVSPPTLNENPAMKITRQLLGLMAAALPLILTLWTTPLMATEEPAFELVGEYQDFELRRYASYLVAEVTVTGDFDDVGSQAFGVLAGYIFGDNQPGEKMAMTAPVSQRPATNNGTRNSINAPYIQASAEQTNAYIVSFVMPTGFTLSTLPEPLDKRIRLREQPARLMAVRTYSGFWNQKNYRTNQDKLLSSVAAADLATLSAPIYARYNPPFTPWFLRRNEVMVEVGCDNQDSSPEVSLPAKPSCV